MSIKHTFNKYFNTHSESSENHWDPNLQTRYFKTTKEKGFKTIEQLFKNSSSYKIVATSEEHGEISVTTKKGRKAFIVATVIMVRPFRTAVDFSVTTESMFPIDLGYSHNLIPKLYEQLKKDLTLIETNN
ncbi:cytosolic protein [Aquibacillus sediminis]|uniref:cytosolic protein n=1 Tax=Aquibacillus sediminis TaxID=2574734 RepID=UPI001108CEF2|nr:cytosolic protein [Aquibacillus sediminis]